MFQSFDQFALIPYVDCFIKTTDYEIVARFGREKLNFSDTSAMFDSVKMFLLPNVLDLICAVIRSTGNSMYAYTDLQNRAATSVLVEKWSQSVLYIGYNFYKVLFIWKSDL